MSFDSLTYAAFLAFTVAVYWRLDRALQNRLLVVLSLFFYGWWDWRFLCLLCGATVVDFHLSRLIAERQDEGQRRRFLLLSIGLNAANLAFFKYFNFFQESLLQALGSLGVSTQWSLLKVALPIGISFYTFEAIAYMVDVYRRKIEPARSLTDYALFITFFPHLVAGPIMRPKAFLSQCAKDRRLTRRKAVAGLDLIVWGLVKKLFIADGVAYYVDRLFSLPEPSTLLIAMGGIGFWIQILADFSAYTDIARGSSKLLGFELARNFHAPYRSRSMAEFWRRWHASLSSWIRDYVYIPLGGSRVSTPRYLVNVFITWALCGLWHGAAWKFVAWGLYHGAFLAVERLRGTARRGAAALAATNLVVIGGWILFRPLRCPPCPSTSAWRPSCALPTTACRPTCWRACFCSTPRHGC